MGRGRDKLGWERLSDVQIPRGTLWFVLASLLYRQRKLGAAIEEFGESASDLAGQLGTDWREGNEREVRLLELQGSVENMTRWLVRLTVLLGAVGILGIAVTIWATV